MPDHPADEVMVQPHLGTDPRLESRSERAKQTSHLAVHALD